MEQNIIISNLNDFIFCPRSIYFHNIYKTNTEKIYQSDVQIKGKLSHKNIDYNKYSSKKNILTGIFVYSEELGIEGRIDIYDVDKKILIERKRKITNIYKGYILQIYAQYFCLIEMHYIVKKIKLYSKIDNKSYLLPLPTNKDKQELKKIINKMRSFDLEKEFTPNKNKCKMCIYRELCDKYK